MMDAPGATEPAETTCDTPHPNAEASTVQKVAGDHNGSIQTEDDNAKQAGDTAEGGGSEDDDDDEEPQLKYAYLTKHLGSVYRNGDATSVFHSTGDKMVCYPGTFRRYAG